MSELIVAMDEKGGICKNNKLPWNSKEELRLFREKTMGRKIVVGSRTANTIPILNGRKVICITNRIKEFKNYEYTPIYCTEDISSVPEDAIVAGGAQIYRLALTSSDRIKIIHLSIIKGEYVCDTFFNLEWIRDFVIVDKKEYKDFTHYTLHRYKSGEYQYLDLLKNIITNGVKREGRNGSTISIFKNDMVFDLREGFPLLTTKKMFLRGIVEEFLFFLRGETDTTYLSEKKVRIWEGNTTKEFISNRGLDYAEGVMGPMYGYQWRFYNAPYTTNENGRPIKSDGGIDQLKNVINTINNDPYSRRILMTSYNPSQAEQGVLYPCHSITIQFYVEGDNLDMYCYNRSQDVFLGVPFNIASSSLLLMTIAKITNKIPRFFHMTMGDTHIYSNHIKQVEQQILRIPYKFPTLKLPEIKTMSDFHKLNVNDFCLEKYNSHSSIKAKMVV